MVEVLASGQPRGFPGVTFVSPLLRRRRAGRAAPFEALLPRQLSRARHITGDQNVDVVPDVSPEEMTPRQQELAKEIAGTREGAVRGPFAIWLRMPELAAKANEFGNALRLQGTIEKRTADDIERSICCSESWRPDLRLNLNFMLGDIQFVPNHAILHAAWGQADTWPQVTEQLSQAHPAALLLLLDPVC